MATRTEEMALGDNLRVYEPEQATLMEADKALGRIGHDAGECREEGPDHGKRAGFGR